MNDLKAICKTLHLAHIIEEFEEIPFESKEQFLRDILSIEVNSRQTTKIARLIKKAKFRELKWLRDYEWSDQLHLPATTSKEEICDLRFKEKTESSTFRNARHWENSSRNGFRCEGM